MPLPWQSKYEDAGKTVANTSLNVMHTYFDKQHAKDPYRGQTENKNIKQGKPDSQFSGKSNRNSGGPNNFQHGGHGGGQGR
jgi:hypothetical protein